MRAGGKYYWKLLFNRHTSSPERRLKGPRREEHSLPTLSKRETAVSRYETRKKIDTVFVIQTLMPAGSMGKRTALYVHHSF